MTLYLERGTIEYVDIPVSITEGSELTDATVTATLVPSTEEPTGWVAAPVTDGVVQYLVDTTALEAGFYSLWLRVTDFPQDILRNVVTVRVH